MTKRFSFSRENSMITNNKTPKKETNLSIFKYIKDNKGRIKGLMVGFAITSKRNNTFAIGYSLCNPKDEFDMETAVKWAYKRATGCESVQIPQSIRKDLSKFADRCRAYFQGRTLVRTFHPVDFNILDFKRILPKEFKDKWEIRNTYFLSDKNKTPRPRKRINVFYTTVMNIGMNTEESPEFPYSGPHRRIISHDFEFKNCVKEEPKGTGSYIKLTIEYVE